MIGLDTNVLVRYLAQDDAKQSALATRLIEKRLSTKNPGFVSLIVLIELCWVLEQKYGAAQSEIGDTIGEMPIAARFQFQERDAVQAAQNAWHRRKAAGVGLPDFLIAELARRSECEAVVTFDKGAVSSTGMSLLT